MGPFPLEDTLGMGPAVVLLQKLLDKGKYMEMVQFSTTRKMWSAFSNVYHASVKGQDSVVLAKNSQKMVVTDCPTSGDWYEKFVKGAHILNG